MRCQTVVFLTPGLSTNMPSFGTLGLGIATRLAIEPKANRRSTCKLEPLASKFLRNRRTRTFPFSFASWGANRHAAYGYTGVTVPRCTKTNFRHRCTSLHWLFFGSPCTLVMPLPFGDTLRSPAGTSSFLHVASDVGAFDLSAGEDGCLAVLHNRNKIVESFASSAWVTQPDGAVLSRSVTSFFLAGCYMAQRGSLSGRSPFCQLNTVKKNHLR